MSTPAWKKRARQEELRKEKLMRDYEKKFSLGTVTKRKKFEAYVPENNYVRDTVDYPSGDSPASSDVTNRPERTEYSGDYLVGIATMHKSNLVPVGKGDDPKHYSTMRRN